MSGDNSISKAFDELCTSIGKMIGHLILVVSMFLWSAFVLIKLWGWFVLVMFPTFPKLNYPIAIGLMVTTSVLMRRNVDRNKKTDYPMAFLLPLISLTVGWITHLFM